MANWMQDLRYAVRTSAKNPALTVVAALALALGIGANTAIFSVIYSLIFRPLPGAADPGRLVSIALTEPEGTYPHQLSYASFRDYSSLKDVFSGATVFTSIYAQFSSEGGSPERILPLLVSGDYFDVLGVKAARGRTFSREEAERMGAGNVLVISHDFWQQRFGGSSDAIGAAVELNGEPFTIVGVTPKEFQGTTGFFTPVGYLPLSGIDYVIPEASKTLEDRARVGGWIMVARLQPGADLEQARAAVQTHAARLAKEYPETQGKQSALVVPEPMARMEPAAIRYMPPIAIVFMTMVCLVLLIACANVANLLLARASGRKKEIAIRAALGAGRWRIIRQLLTESVLLSALGAGLGWLLAQWAIRVLSSVRPATDLPLQFSLTLDYRVFAFTLAVTVLTGILVGLVPALQAARTDSAAALKEGWTGAEGRSRSFLRSSLVVAQMSVSLVLLISTGLFVRSTMNAAQQDLGFDQTHLLLVAMDTDLRRYDEARSQDFYRDLDQRVRSLPGVVDVSSARFLPIGFGNGAYGVEPEGLDVNRDQSPPQAIYNLVGTDYFRTMKLEVQQGRAFTEQDRTDSPQVAIINQTFADKFWPRQNPLGKRFRIDREDKLLEVVGVARDSKYMLPAEGPTPAFYMPFSQLPRSDRILHIRTQGDPVPMAAAVRSVIHALDQEMPIWDVRSMQDHIRNGKMFLFDIGTGLMGAFGLIGMILAAIGLYGVMAYSVSRRTHEIGIRMAIGASGGRIRAMVVRQGMILAALGVLLGLAGAGLLTRLFANLLVGVTSTDPLTFGAIALFLLAVGLLACYVPARRATRVDPMIALRYE